MKMVTTNPGCTLEEREIHCVEQARGPIAKITEETDQEILGFGAALTDASCIMLNRLSPEDRKKLLHAVYSPEESNFSVTRLCVGSSDYAGVEYHFAPVPEDMNMEHFDASHDDKDIIPVVKEAMAENPDLYLFSSPWSPPGWMKSSKAMQGGWMLDKYLDAYALYYLKFLQYYLKNGIKIQALTPQNESETDQSSRMPACLWHPETEMKFAKKLRRLLDENEEFRDVKIWLIDHNFVMWHRAVFQMDDPETKAACAGIAWHPYEGYAEQVGYFRRQHPECENHWTEGKCIINMHGFSLNGPRPRLNLGQYGQSFISALQNGIQSITLWNLALDEFGYPNIGPFAARGAVEISRDSKRITPSEEYKALVHFSKYIQRGAKRLIVDTSAVPNNFAVAAFRNPDGTTVVTVSNTEEFDSGLNLEIDGKTVALWVLRESVNTVLL